MFWSLATNLGTSLKATKNLGTQKVNDLKILNTQFHHPKYLLDQGTLPAHPYLSSDTQPSVPQSLPNSHTGRISKTYNGEAQASIMSDLFQTNEKW